jgi:hypothetical protein
MDRRPQLKALNDALEGKFVVVGCMGGVGDYWGLWPIEYASLHLMALGDGIRGRKYVSPITKGVFGPVRLPRPSVYVSLLWGGSSSVQCSWAIACR